ncbi:MAG: hypothetical protein ACK4GJ_05915 [bacterium]
MLKIQKKIQNLYQEIEKLKLEDILNKNFCTQKNIKPFIVGGFIRDCLLNNKKNNTPIDIDIVFYIKNGTETYKNYIRYLCKECNYKIVELDNQRLVYRAVINQNLYLDFTYTHDLQNDFQRRDYTINSLYFDMINQKIVDFDNCINDITNKKIKAVNLENLIIDPIRMLRGIRIKYELSLSFDEQTYKFISQNFHKIYTTNPVRLRQELTKIFNLSKTYQPVKKLIQLGLFEAYGINLPDDQSLEYILKVFDLNYIIFNEIMQKEYNLFLKSKAYYALLLLCSYLIKNLKERESAGLYLLFGENIVKKSYKIIQNWNKRQDRKFIIDSFKHKNDHQIFEIMFINLLLNLNKLDDQQYLSTLQFLFRVCKYVCENKENILSYDEYLQLFNQDNYEKYIDYIVSIIPSLS